MSNNPKPPGISDAKYKVFPSLLTEGFLTKYSFLFLVKVCTFTQDSQSFVPLNKYNKLFLFFTSLFSSKSPSAKFSLEKYMVFTSGLKETKPSWYLVLTPDTA